MRRMLIVLTTVMVLSGIILAATYSSLSPKIEENRKIALNNSLASLFEKAEGLVFEQLPGKDIIIYKASSESGQLDGYAVQVQTQGYGGAMTLLVGLSSDLNKTEGLKVVEQLETPGLGGRISEKRFQDQFRGLAASTVISYVKNVKPVKEKNEIQAISGATITSKAVVDAINVQLAEALKIIKEQKP